MTFRTTSSSLIIPMRFTQIYVKNTVICSKIQLFYPCYCHYHCRSYQPSSKLKFVSNAKQTIRTLTKVSVTLLVRRLRLHKNKEKKNKASRVQLDPLVLTASRISLRFVCKGLKQTFNCLKSLVVF